LIFGASIGLVLSQLVESAMRFGWTLRLVHELPQAITFIVYAGMLSAACAHPTVGYWLVILFVLPLAWLVGSACAVLSPPAFPPTSFSGVVAWVALGCYTAASLLLLSRASRSHFYQAYLSRMKEAGARQRGVA
jgi:hypothetical protein